MIFRVNYVVFYQSHYSLWLGQGWVGEVSAEPNPRVDESAVGDANTREPQVVKGIGGFGVCLFNRLDDTNLKESST